MDKLGTFMLQNPEYSLQKRVNPDYDKFIDCL